jgi:hypothetical protein
MRGTALVQAVREVPAAWCGVDADVSSTDQHCTPPESAALEDV